MAYQKQMKGTTAIFPSKTNILKLVDGKYSLEKQDDFKFPKKIYGNPQSVVDRIITTFESRESNLGVLFSGIKGNSKTTTAKLVCSSSSLPVVIISQPYTGSEFTSFISNLPSCIVFVDEFEKVYNTTELQQEFLTILDGVVQGKRLFLFTSNSSEINPFLRNRPSRIFYHFKYDNLDEELVNEIIDDTLTNKDFEADLRSILMIIGNPSIDVLLNIIDEVNRFNESPKVLIKGLNVEVEQTEFDVMLLVKGQKFNTKCNFNPLTKKEFYLDYKDENGRWGWISGNLKDYSMYTRGKTFVFENVDNKIFFTPYKSFKFEL